MTLSRREIAAVRKALGFALAGELEWHQTTTDAMPGAPYHPHQGRPQVGDRHRAQASWRPGVEDITVEENNQRADAAGALFREIVRRARG